MRVLSSCSFLVDRISCLWIVDGGVDRCGYGYGWIIGRQGDGMGWDGMRMGIIMGWDGGWAGVAAVAASMDGSSNFQSFTGNLRDWVTGALSWPWARACADCAIGGLRCVARGSWVVGTAAPGDWCALRWILPRALRRRRGEDSAGVRRAMSSSRSVGQGARCGRREPSSSYAMI